jgi:hypothetical protein
MRRDMFLPIAGALLSGTVLSTISTSFGVVHPMTGVLEASSITVNDIQSKKKKNKTQFNRFLALPLLLEHMHGCNKTTDISHIAEALSAHTA